MDEVDQDIHSVFKLQDHVNSLIKYPMQLNEIK